MCACVVVCIYVVELCILIVVSLWCIFGGCLNVFLYLCVYLCANLCVGGCVSLWLILFFLWLCFMVV